ncbi:Mur ligase domain-containing protein, partial [Clostridium estertheticum]
MDNKKKVHFMGICGSGAAPIAVIAKNMGFDVSGCDLNMSAYYNDALVKNSIEIFKGHDLNHIQNVDILAISPAILDISPNHPEFFKDINEVKDSFKNFIKKLKGSKILIVNEDSAA